MRPNREQPSTPAAAGPDAAARPTVAVVADDLVWATRLAAIVERAGGRSLPARDAAGLERALAAEPPVAGVVVDLGGRRFDGVTAIARAVAAGRPVLAVGQHTATELRRRARTAGASQVHAYRRLFEDGPAVVAAWLGLPRPPKPTPPAAGSAPEN